MPDDTAPLKGPDLTQGVELSAIPDASMLLGHARGEAVMLVRHGDEIFAIGAICTHYGAPLEQGLLVGETVRCQWHHACFSLRTGEALRAPALDPVSRWRVEQVRDPALHIQGEPQLCMVYVREKLQASGKRVHAPAAGTPGTVVIVGGGAAGNAAAEALRHQGYQGRITLLSADANLPCDRPKLSKGFLAGAESDASTLLRPAQFYRDHGIELHLEARVAAIDVRSGHVEMADGARHDYGALLLATGAEPVRLDVPGCDLSHVHYLRSLADARALVAKSLIAKRAVVIGASFIGLEVAASLRARNIEVHVVAPDAIPMAKILGDEVGAFFRALHEQHGVVFHLGTTATAIDANSVTLKTGERLAADLVVVGIGVRPALALAENAGLAIDRGVSVDDYLETSVPRIYAAGDIARWPDRLTGQRLRVEHWVVAERQGQVAAHNMLGMRERFNHVPFFWTEQYDFGLGYVGHAEKWDRAEIAGSLQASDATVSYWLGGRKLAMAIIHRDLDGLRAEVEFEAVIAGRQAMALVA